MVNGQTAGSIPLLVFNEDKYKPLNPLVIVKNMPVLCVKLIPSKAFALRAYR